MPPCLLFAALSMLFFLLLSDRVQLVDSGLRMNQIDTDEKYDELREKVMS